MGKPYAIFLLTNMKNMKVRSLRVCWVIICARLYVNHSVPTKQLIGDVVHIVMVWNESKLMHQNPHGTAVKDVPYHDTWCQCLYHNISTGYWNIGNHRVAPLKSNNGWLVFKQKVTTIIATIGSDITTVRSIVD